MVTSLLDEAIVLAAEAHPSARFLLIGSGSEAFRSALVARDRGLADRVSATGLLNAAGLAAHIAACDVMLQPYPDGVTSRRTTAMAGLFARVPVVTTQGMLTERFWQEEMPVKLAAVGDVRRHRSARPSAARGSRGAAASGRRRPRVLRSMVRRAAHGCRARRPHERQNRHQAPCVHHRAATGRGDSGVPRAAPISPLLKAWGLWALNQRLVAELGSQVLDGPFTGMTLSALSRAEHIGPYLLGTYEAELHDTWNRLLQREYSEFVDVGANFGYYAVGLARRFPAQERRGVRRRLVGAQGGRPDVCGQRRCERVD